MHEPATSREKPYRTYEPYPVSEGGGSSGYSDGEAKDARAPPSDSRAHDDFFPPPDLATDPFPSDLSEPPPSGRAGGFRPLQLLGSLFADRMSLLQRALDELEAARHDRERLNTYAMAELDPEIRACEQSLENLVRVRLLDDPDYRRRLEQRLFDLKRERRREALLSWRDLLWLRGEIRKLQRELDAIPRTARPATDRQAPR